MRLLRLVGLTVKFDEDPNGVWSVVRPHFKAAVVRSMVEHVGIADVRTPYEAVDGLIYALQTVATTVRMEASMGKLLPAAYLAMSAQERYQMVVTGVAAGWRGAPGDPVLLYDERLQQMEDLFRDVHRLFHDLCLAENHRSRDARCPVLGALRYLPGEV
jgi:hypothetical protein